MWVPRLESFVSITAFLHLDVLVMPTSRSASLAAGRLESSTCAQSRPTLRRDEKDVVAPYSGEAMIMDTMSVRALSRVGKTMSRRIKVLRSCSPMS